VSQRVKKTMVKLFKILLTYKLKDPKPSQKNGGFTLIELLVGLILAFLVILPLLAFMVNMLNTDRQEQAKASSDQEIQTALTYISRDLEQAVHIYDSYGINRIQNYLPNPANSVPVLVFWKRQFVPDIIPTNQGGNDDAFVYALVAYYLKTPTQAECTQANYPWSCTAQITRVVIRDSVKDRAGNIVSGSRAQADTGFKLFDPKVSTSGSTEEIMNAWTSDGGTRISKPTEELIDYIDQTPVSTPAVLCPPIQRATSPDPNNTAATYSAAYFHQVPNPANIQVNGFYVCVDSEKTTAQVFIRGNALARLQKKQNPPIYSRNQAAFFPKASIQVKGRGLFSSKQSGE
jgi:type II secretory pathway pseudopilin PulG